MAKPRLETRRRQAFKALGIPIEKQVSIETFLNIFLMKGEAGKATREHSIRVALLARDIGKFMGVDERALFYAGLLHDVGKCLTNLKTLSKTEI